MTYLKVYIQDLGHISKWPRFEIAGRILLELSKISAPILFDYITI